MADAAVKRRGHGEDAIYFAAEKNRYIGAVSRGFGPDGKRLRRKVSGKTKQEVRDKLRAMHAELDAGFKISQLTAGLSWATYRARSPGEPTRGTPAARINGRRNPAQFTVAATS